MFIENKEKIQRYVPPKSVHKERFKDMYRLLVPVSLVLSRLVSVTLILHIVLACPKSLIPSPLQCCGSKVKLICQQVAASTYEEP